MLPPGPRMTFGDRSVRYCIRLGCVTICPIQRLELFPNTVGGTLASTSLTLIVSESVTVAVVVNGEVPASPGPANVRAAQLFAKNPTVAGVDGSTGLYVESVVVPVPPPPPLLLLLFGETPFLQAAA